MTHFCKLEKQFTHRKNGSHLEKRSHTFENGSHLEKWFTLAKMGHTLGNGSHFEKWVILKKMQKNKNDEKSKTTAKLTKRDIFMTIFRLARPAFFRFRCSIKRDLRPRLCSLSSLLLKNASHIEKWETLGTTGHTWKNGSHLQK